MSGHPNSPVTARDTTSQKPLRYVVADKVLGAMSVVPGAVWAGTRLVTPLLRLADRVKGRRRIEPPRRLRPAELRSCTVPPALRAVSTDDLVAALAARVPAETDRQRVTLLAAFQRFLADELDLPRNRFAVAHLREWFRALDHVVQLPSWGGLREAWALELGAGAENPLARVFLLHLLGAERVAALDIAPMLDPSRAARALADVAARMLTDPRAIVGARAPKTGEVLARLAGHDLGRLARGDLDGLDRSRVVHLQEPVESISLPDDSVGLIVSNAFLEHVRSVDRALAEMARVAKPGCIGVHVIDGTDHRHYEGLVDSPLAFLREPAGEELVGSSNRVRCHEYVPRFEQHGFEILDLQPLGPRIELSDAEIAAFAEPWRSMRRSDLERPVARFTLRYRGT